MTYQDLVTEVTDRTQGTKNDPLGREEVEQVVVETLKVLRDEGFSIILEGAPE